MKAIKCPNCGSEQVKELTEEKYACPQFPGQGQCV